MVDFPTLLGSNQNHYSVDLNLAAFAIDAAEVVDPNGP